MAKYELRIQAENLRRKGKSMKEITSTLGVSKGSVSLWTRDVLLTTSQMQELKKKMKKGAKLGRMKILLARKEHREKIKQEAINNGLIRLKNLKEREFLIAGLALYWGEGSKKTQEVEFCNSDPKMIKFLIDWLFYFFEIDKSRIKCKLGINESHRKRELLVKNFWSKEIDIPSTQFLKTNFKKTANKKVYANFDQHYGVLTISILKPTITYHKIIGLIEALYTVEQEKYKNMPG